MRTLVDKVEEVMLLPLIKRVRQEPERRSVAWTRTPPAPTSACFIITAQ